MKRRKPIVNGTLKYPPYYRIGWRTTDLFWCPKCRAYAKVIKKRSRLYLHCVILREDPCPDVLITQSNS